MFYIEDLAPVMLWALVLELCLIMAMIAIMLRRRIVRRRYFAYKDDARQRHRDAILRYLAGERSLESILGTLGRSLNRAQTDAVHEIVFSLHTPDSSLRATDLLFAMGHVDGWARTIFGRRQASALVRAARAGDLEFRVAARGPRWLSAVAARWRRLRINAVPRAIAMSCLARLHPPAAAVFGIAGLSYPAVTVRIHALHALGRSGRREAMEAVLSEIRQTAELCPAVSIRSLKTALIQFPLADSAPIASLLDNPEARIRVVALDALREIASRAGSEKAPKPPRPVLVIAKSPAARASEASTVLDDSKPGSQPSVSGLEKSDFPDAVHTKVLAIAATDPSGDVRARAAGLIGHFHDRPTISALSTLLKDENEFARLHAARACADRYYAELVPELGPLLIDSKWRVRESAVRSAMAHGAPGLRLLYDHFLGTQDRYSCEQIGEQLQRSGVISGLIESLGERSDRQHVAEAICRKLTSLGWTSLLLEHLSREATSVASRLALMDLLGEAPSDEFLALLDRLAASQDAALAAKAVFLRRNLTVYSSVSSGAAG